MTNEKLYQAIVKELRRDDEERQRLEREWQSRCVKQVVSEDE